MKKAPSGMWLKEEDTRDPKNPWITFSFVNEEKESIAWDKKLFPNRFHYTAYPEAGFSQPLIVCAEIIRPYKPRAEELKMAKSGFSDLKKEVSRIRIDYKQPGFYFEDGEFLDDLDYIPGQTYVEGIEFNNKRGFSNGQRDNRQAQTSYDKKGAITRFMWPLSTDRLQEKGDSRFWMGTVDVKGERSSEPMGFVEAGLENETAETELMRRWFAGNVPGAKFPCAKAFDFSHVQFDSFKQRPGQKMRFDLVL